MSTGDDAEVLRSVTREVLAELLPGLLEEALTAQPAANGNGHHAAADDSAASGRSRSCRRCPRRRLRPCTARPAGARRRSPTRPGHPPRPPRRRPPPRASADAAIERVDLRTDADLDAFVRSLVRRLENPRDRMAIRSGRLRFRLGAIGDGCAAPPRPARRCGSSAAR